VKRKYEENEKARKYAWLRSRNVTKLNNVEIEKERKCPPP
jgi:hypothetical protein